MTAADAGIKQMTVVGPQDTSHFIATLRSAVQRYATPDFRARDDVADS